MLQSFVSRGHGGASVHRGGNSRGTEAADTRIGTVSLQCYRELVRAQDGRAVEDEVQSSKDLRAFNGAIHGGATPQRFPLTARSMGVVRQGC